MELEKAIVLSALLAQRRQNLGMALRTFHPKKRMAIAEALKGQIAVAIGGLKDEGGNRSWRCFPSGSVS